MSQSYGHYPLNWGQDMTKMEVAQHEQALLEELLQQI
jgi:hypothetical protein